MYISEDKKKTMRCGCIYLGVAAFALLFGTVYEQFSHGVFSWHMAFLFVFPLIGGALPYMIAAILRGAPAPGSLSACLWNSGIAALTVGSCVQGVLEIYGTTSPYLPLFYVAGGVFCALGAAAYIRDIRTCRKRRSDKI